MPTAGERPTAGAPETAAPAPDAAADPPQALPAGRYGVSPDAATRTDRRLKVTGGVLGAALLAFLGWVGVSQVTSQPVSGELTGFTVVSETEVEATLQVRKPAGTTGVCTVRSQAEDGLEVGRAEFVFDDDRDSVHRAVTLRTTQLATSAELLSCDEATD